MPWVLKGRFAIATDLTTAPLITGPSETRDRIMALLGTEVPPLVAAAMADDPTIRDTVIAAIEEGLNAAEYKPRKCVHLESGKWVWDGPGGLAATHYVLPDDTGALVVRPTVWPVPGATPEFTW